MHNAGDRDVGFEHVFPLFLSKTFGNIWPANFTAGLVDTDIKSREVTFVGRPSTAQCGLMILAHDNLNGLLAFQLS